MELEARYLEIIPQTRYLSAENYVSYRAIMRIFYQEHQKMHYQLDKQTIMGKLRQDRLFSDYSEQQLSQDLDQLIRWKNLTAIQDPRKVRTVADFQNKQYQYMMSQAALEIERMTITLENLYTHTTGLTSSSFRRIQRALDKIETLDQMPLKEIGDWWKDLQEDFSRLSQSYQDYLREFYGPSAEKYMKSEDFLVYKRHLITYLEDFVQDLQSNSAQISAQLESLSSETTAKLLNLVHQSELDVPRPLSEKTEHWQEELRMKNEGVWQSLVGWFSGADSTARQVMEVTNEVIRRVVQNAAMLVQMQNMGVSNKAELCHMMKLFSQVPSLDEAHKLSALVFGAQHARHYVVNSDRETDRIDISCFQEAPMEYLLRPRERTYRPSIDRSGFADRSADKKEQRRRILEEAELLRTEVMGHIRDKKLDFAHLEKPVTPEVRTVFLSWLAIANLSPDKKGSTEYGQRYSLRPRGKGKCTMVCTDGELTLPDCVLEFEDDVNV